MSDRPSGDPERGRFDLARSDAGLMLANDGQPSLFAVWALGTLRGEPDRYLRYAILDGIMAALDDDEARRT